MKDRRADRLLTLALALPLLLAPRSGAAQDAVDAAAAAPAPASGVIATVNGEPVHFEQLERLLASMHRGASDTRRQAPDVDRLVFRLVNDTLLAQEARSMGMQHEPPIPEQVSALREKLAVQRLEQVEVWTGAEPTEEELRRAFQEEYRTVTLHMATAYEREEAEQLLQELREGADFEALARERSVDPYGPRGGRVEELPNIDMPHEFADEAFASEPGEIAGPLRTRIGWTVLRVESFADPEPERFEELKASLGELVRYRKAEVLRRDLGVRLREAHPVAVEPGAVEAIVAERLTDARLMPKVEDPAAVVARVGDREITAAELGDALKRRWSGVRNEEAALAARSLVLERLIRDELMRAEALARGYGDTPEARRAMAAYETQRLIPRVLNEVVAANVEVTREEMERYYEQNRGRFHRPPRVHLGQITVAEEEEAERLAELLRKGTDLAWLARQHSVDRFKDAGGERGWVVPARRGDPIEEALFEAQPGDVLGPSPVADGFVVVRVDAREEQGIYDFEEVSGNVRQAVYDVEFQRALHEYIQKLRGRSKIDIHEETLATMRITGSRVEEKGHSGGAAHP
jgi:peptidyl-prolyl cis-trans isomerase C